MTEQEEAVVAVFQKALDGIESVCAKAGTTAKDIWDISIKAKKVEAIVEIFNSLAVGVVVIVLLAWAWHVHKTPLEYMHHLDLPDTTTGESDLLVASGIVAALVGLIAFIVSMCMFWDAVGRLFTTKYHAYREILKDWRQ